MARPRKSLLEDSVRRYLFFTIRVPIQLKNRLVKEQEQ